MTEYARLTEQTDEAWNKPLPGDPGVFLVGEGLCRRAIDTCDGLGTGRGKPVPYGPLPHAPSGNLQIRFITVVP